MRIEEIRRDIEEVDRSIIELLAKRLKLVEEIAKLKQAKNMSIVDDIREVELKLFWRKSASMYCIPLDLVDQMFSLILSYSKDVQLKSTVYNSCPTDRGGIAIVGYGKMAQALGTILIRGGYSVTVTGKDQGKANILAKTLGCKASSIGEAIQDNKYVVLALSMEAFKSGFIDGVVKHMSGKIVMDILSAKSWVFKYLERLSKDRQFHYVSTHPLFGPSTTAVGQKIVLMPSETGSEVLEEVVLLWRCVGLDTVIAEYEEHEKAMAIVQVLTHLLLTVFQLSAEELSKKLDVSYVKFSTPTFREITAVVLRLSGIRDTILEIQKNNIFTPLVYEVVLNVVNNLVAQLGGDR